MLIDTAKAKNTLKTWPYIHDKLEHEQSIRVSDLWPGKFEDDLMVSLCTTSLDKKPVYEAISYVRKSTAKKQRVLIMEPDNWNGFGYVDLPANLCMALRRLRREDEEVCLWADALCINEDDVLEKSHQVCQMADIFSKAKQVLVWLGPDTYGEGAKAFHLAEKLAKVNEPTASPYATKAQSREKKQKDTETEALGILRGDGVSLLVWLTQQAWFGRVWTMEELGCSTAATILMGDASIAWNLLYGAYDLATHLQVGGKDKERFSIITNLYHWRTSDWLGFLRTVSRFRHHDTSDPRDRIYGLLGHPSAFVRTDEGNSVPILQPDYRKTVNEVYMDAAEAMLLQEGNLDMLSFVRPRTSVLTNSDGPQFPSWAPDWKSEEVTHHISDGKQNSCGTIGGPLYHLPPVVKHKADVHELHTSGIDYGHVIWSRSTRDMNRLGDITTFRASSPHLVHDPSYYLTRAVHAHSLPRFNEIPFDEHQDSGFRQRTLDIAVKTMEANLSIGRRVFFTDTNFYGLGPETTQKGDVLYVLHAGRVPYLLRPGGVNSSKAPLANSTHTLVGECLIEELMHGEAIARADEARDLVLV